MFGRLFTVVSIIVMFYGVHKFGTVVVRPELQHSDNPFQTAFFGLVVLGIFVFVAGVVGLTVAGTIKYIIKG